MDDSDGLFWGGREATGRGSPTASLYLTNETRVDLDPPTPPSLIQIQLPSTNAFGRIARSERRVVNSVPTYDDEDTFSRSCIASASSIHFGKSRRHPRNFLWRVREDSKVLELRSADLSKGERETREATLTLQLGFLGTIRHGCVSFADDGQDILSAFVLTKGNDLFTLSIPVDFFCNATASEKDVDSWCKTFKPATFSMSRPHRMVASNPNQIIISLDDGRLLRLMRQDGADGSAWKERVYNDGQWGSSLRGLIRWQGSNTIRYNGNVLDQSTAIAIAFSPSQTHVLTVCANHTLKIWNLAKPSSVFSMDLVGEQREPQDIPKVMLDPGNPELLRVFEAQGAIDGDQYYAITYSPHDRGQFKIWAVRDADQGGFGVRFLHADQMFRAPDPDPNPESKAVWKVADFKIRDANSGINMGLWALMRSNRKYKVYNLKFDLEQMPTAWENNWVMTASEAINRQSLPQLLNRNPQDVSELWLEHILYPGKFSRTILETALAIYSSARKIIPAAGPKAALEERMCSAIAAQVALQPVEDIDRAGSHFSQYRTAMHEEWGLLYQNIQDLNHLKWQILAIAYDQSSDMPWLMFTGGCAAVRESTQVEIPVQNLPANLRESAHLLERPSVEDRGVGVTPILPYEVALLIEAVASFRESFNASLTLNCRTALSEELWKDPLYLASARIGSFYDRCGFADELLDASIDDLTEALRPLRGFGGLSTQLFSEIIGQTHPVMSTIKGLKNTEFGIRALVMGAQQIIDLHEQILFDLLMLLVFAAIEVDRDVTPMPELDFVAAFEALLEQLRRSQMMQWLSKHTRVEPNKATIPMSRSSNGPSVAKPAQSQKTTVLQNLFSGGVIPISTSRLSESAVLTRQISDLLIWVVGGNDAPATVDHILIRIQCDLLANDNIDLASDFLRFQPSTPWSSYVKGRLNLVRGDFDEAAIYFQRAAFKLGIFSLDNCPLLFAESTVLFSAEILSELLHRLRRVPFPCRGLSLWRRCPLLLHPRPPSLRIRFLPIPSHPIRRTGPPFRSFLIRKSRLPPDLPPPSMPPNLRSLKSLHNPNPPPTTNPILPPTQPSRSFLHPSRRPRHLARAPLAPSPPSRNRRLPLFSQDILRRQSPLPSLQDPRRLASS